MMRVASSSRSRLAWVFSFCFGALALAACGGSETPQAPEGGDATRSETAQAAAPQPSAQAAKAGPQAIVYVSPTGNDNNSGKEPTAPLRTLQRARDLVRTMNATMSGDIVVYLRGGVYPIGSTVTFDAADSGSNGFAVKYANYPGEIPVLDGGRRITGWVLHDASKGIYRASTGGLQFRQLYVGAQRAQRARSPNADDFRTLAAWNNATKRISVARDEVASWRNFSEVEIVVQTFFTDSRMRLASFTADATNAQLKINPVEEKIAFVRDSPGGRAGQGYHFENAYEFIDQPGEWYLDRAASTVYYKPRTGESMATVEAVVPAVETLLQVQGTLEKPVTDLWFHGLVFQHTSWLRPDQFGHLPVQASNYALQAFGSDGGQFYAGRPPAAIEVVGAQRVRFERNKVRRTGATGIDLHFGVHDSQLVGNEVSDISANGINVGKYSDENVEVHAIYNPRDLREVNSNNLVANNYVHEYGQDYAGAVGIGLGYTRSNSVVSNEVANAAYSGISLGWGWRSDLNASRTNVIKFNRVHNVLQQLGDGGGIYLLGASPKTRVGWNWVHDLVRNPLATKFPIAGLYIDAGFDGSYVENNVFTNTGDRPIHRPLVKSTAFFNNDSQDQKIKDGAGIPAAHADVKLQTAAPSLDLRDGATQAFAAIADSTVRQDAPGMANELTELNVQAKSSALRRSFLRFRVAGTSGRAVKTVKLRLTQARTSSPGYANVEVRSVTGRWDEAEVNWGSQPAVASTPLGTLSTAMADGKSIDIALDKALVKGDGIYDLALWPLARSEAAFASRELVGAPELVIEFDSGASNPQPPTPPPAGQPGTLLFDAVEDARVDEAVPGAASGRENVVGVKYVAGSSRFSYLRFNVSGLAGKTITAVTLQLQESARSGEGDTQFAVRKVEGAWNESGVVWINRPSPVGPVLGTFAGAKLRNGQLLEIPLTVASIAGDGVLNLGLIATAQSTNDSEFSSREGERSPRLVIAYR
jgi:hypothetical protein